MSVPRVYLDIRKTPGYDPEVYDYRLVTFEERSSVERGWKFIAEVNTRERGNVYLFAREKPQPEKEPEPCPTTSSTNDSAISPATTRSSSTTPSPSTAESAPPSTTAGRSKGS